MYHEPFDYEKMMDTIISYYQDGYSLTETASHFSISPTTVYRCLERGSVARRSPGEGKRWTPEALEKHRANLVGKPSNASGKTWKIGRPVHKPTLRGEKNVAWKGGTTSLSKLIRESSEYRIWRDAIFSEG